MPTSARPGLAHARRAVLALAATASVAVAPTALAAQQPARRDSVRTARDTARLRPVVVTATRTPVRADELAQRTIVVTREDIERTPANDVVDVLKRQAGVDVVQYPTMLASVSVRGFRPTTGIQPRTLVLVDGRPAGSFNLALLDLNAIERVEVLKGPASALYGSGAVGGVVNFITRRSTGRVGGTVSALYGSFQTSDLSLRAGGELFRRGGVAIDADVDARRFDQAQDIRLGRGGVFRDALGGDSVTRVFTGTTRPDQVVNDAIGDGQRRPFTTFGTNSGGLRLGASFGAGWRADVRADVLDANDVLSPGDIVQVGGGGNGRTNVFRRGEEIALRRDPARAAGARHLPLLRVFRAREGTEFYNTPADTGFVNFTGSNRTQGFQVQDAIRLGGQVLTVGIDGTEVTDDSRRFARAAGVVSPIAPFSPNSRYRSTAGFAQLQLRAFDGRVTGTVGGRYDRVELALRQTALRPDVTAGTDRFGAFTPSAGVQVQLGRGLRAHGTYGEAFVIPLATQLAGFSTATSATAVSFTIGNPTLDPERSRTWDAGITWERPEHGATLGVTYFDTDVRDRLTTVRGSFAPGGRPVTAQGQQIAAITTAANAGRATVRGLEVEGRYDVARALGKSWSLALVGNVTRLLAFDELMPAARVDTAGLGGLANATPELIFDRIRLDASAARPVRIRNVAPTTVTGALEVDGIGRLRGRLGARYLGRRFDSDFSNFADPADVFYAPILVTDLSLGVRVTARYRLDGEVSNLTDENFYEKRGFNLPGRALRLRISATF